MKILGIDEAGRGPILGSLFLCGLVCNERDLPYLKGCGVKDSKLFGSGSCSKIKRRELALKLKKKFDYKIEKATAKQIDFFVSTRGLNRLERKLACKIINSLEKDKIILDGLKIFSPLQKKYSNLVAIDKGDENNIVVAAASILAKDARDYDLNKLYKPFEKDYGKIKGGGYANQGSLDFVVWHLKKYQKVPNFYRQKYNYKNLIKVIGSYSPNT